MVIRHCIIPCSTSKQSMPWQFHPVPWPEYKGASTCRATILTIYWFPEYNIYKNARSESGTGQTSLLKLLEITNTPNKVWPTSIHDRIRTMNDNMKPLLSPTSAQARANHQRFFIINPYAASAGTIFLIPIRWHIGRPEYRNSRTNIGWGGRVSRPDQGFECE